MQHLETIKTILGDVLALGERKDSLTGNSGLMGSIPEFDSMAVVNVLTALEDHFGFTIDDDEISASTFETVGTLVQFVDDKLGA